MSGQTQYFDQTQDDEASINYVVKEQQEEDLDYTLFGGINRIQMPTELNELSDAMNHQKAINVFMEMNRKPITFELDTDACVTLVSQQTWKGKLESVNLSKTSLVFKICSVERLGILGKAEVSVKHEGQVCKLPLYVVEGHGPSLLSRNCINCKIEPGFSKTGVIRFRKCC